MNLSKSQQQYLKGYAQALSDIMIGLTGDNTCSKSYDPISFDENYIHSYAFNLKDGGRHHPLEDYETVEEITQLMIKETISFIED